MRVLIIAESANPEWVSVPLEGYSHARAIARQHDAHLVTHPRNREALLRAGVDPESFTTIDNEWIARPIHRFEKLIRRGDGTGWTTSMAMRWIPYRAFESRIWKEFGPRVRQGDYDVVHRLTPLSPTVPSTLAARCAKAGVPFVVGPLNGGLPWPKGFDRERRREREWLSYVRQAYELVPGYRSMRRHASALIIGSRATFEQMDAKVHDRCVYIPENAIDPARFGTPPQRQPLAQEDPIRVSFVGRLVPYKGCDMLIEGASLLIREGRIKIDIIGDGPERGRLEAMVAREGIASGVRLVGWVEHADLQGHLARAHVLGFPSVREFGGAVVLEAMAMGVVPLVLDYGGPGELVDERCGFALPMGSREQVVARVRESLTRLANNPAQIEPMSEAAMHRARTLFTWDTKASMVGEVYRWVVGEREKPDFGMPLSFERCALAVTGI